MDETPDTTQTESKLAQSKLAQSAAPQRPTPTLEELHDRVRVLEHKLAEIEHRHEVALRQLAGHPSLGMGRMVDATLADAPIKYAADGTPVFYRPDSTVQVPFTADPAGASPHNP